MISTICNSLLSFWCPHSTESSLRERPVSFLSRPSPCLSQCLATVCDVHTDVSPSPSGSSISLQIQSWGSRNPWCPVSFPLQKPVRGNGFPGQVLQLDTAQREEALTPFMSAEGSLTLPDPSCPKHTDGGALGVAHIVDSLLSSFLHDELDCGWKVIVSHLVHAVKEKEQQNWGEKNPSHCQACNA